MKPAVLIVCQGKVTEPEYFKLLKSMYKLSSVSIKHENDGSPDKHTQCQFIVSNEAFDAWLLAHYEDLKGKSYSRKQIASKLTKTGVLYGPSKKSLSSDFPVLKHDEARQQIDVIAPNEIGRPISTAIPHLIDALLLLRV